MDQHVKEGIIDLINRQRKQYKLVDQFYKAASIEFYELPPHKKADSLIDIVLDLLGVEKTEDNRHSVGVIMTGASFQVETDGTKVIVDDAEMLVEYLLEKKKEE